MANIAKVTSKRTVDEKTKVVTTVYSDGRKTTDTPNVAKGGFDRVKLNADKTTETSYIPPRFKAGGSATEPLGVATIPKGTPLTAVSAILADCVTQAESRGGKVTSVTGTVKLF